MAGSDWGTTLTISATVATLSRTDVMLIPAAALSGVGENCTTIACWPASSP